MPPYLPTIQRGQVDDLVKAGDLEEALRLALQIEDGWFAYQSLANILRHAPEEKLHRIASHIPTHAARAGDAYQQSSVRAWDIRAWVERGHITEAEQTLAEAVGTAMKTMSLCSRSEALFGLFQAIHPVGTPHVSILTRLIADTWRLSPHWRCARNLRDALAMIARVDAGTYDEIFASIDDSRLKKAILRESESNRSPRPYFW